jgi:hypothetical protein
MGRAFKNMPHQYLKVWGHYSACFLEHCCLIVAHIHTHGHHEPANMVSRLKVAFIPLRY